MLQKSILTIPLGLGVNTKTDEKLVEQGKFNLVCENATFQKIGSVTKRQGYEPMSTDYFQPDYVTGTGYGNYTSMTPTCVATLGKSVFLKNQLGEYLYSHENGFVMKDEYPIPECKVTTFDIYPSKSTIDTWDTEYDSDEDIILAACRNRSISSSSAYSAALVIFDNEKKSSVTLETDETSLGFGFVRCGLTRVSGQSYYYRIHVGSSSLLFISVYDRFGQTSGTLSVSNIGVSPLAVCRSSDGGTYYIIATTTTANLSRIIVVKGGAIAYNLTFATTTSGGWGSASARFDSATNLVYFAYTDAGGQVRQVVFDQNGAIIVNDTALANATSALSISYRKDSDKLFINDSNGWSGYDPNTLSKYIENYNTEICSDMIEMSGVKCALAIDTLGNLTYFGTGPKSVSFAGTTVFARLSPGTGANTTGQIGRIVKISESMAVVAHAKLSQRSNQTYFYNLALTYFEINPDYTSNNRAILGKNLHFQGGFLTEFDGEKVFENGFHLKCPTLELAGTVAGSLSGTYSYIGVLKYIDRNGQVTRSQPSDAASITVASKAVTITMKSMPFGIKPIACILEIYRNENNGTTYYLTIQKKISMYSARYAWSDTVNDTSSDASIRASSILYTTGNVLANNPAPSCRLVTQGGNRLWLAGLEDENVAAYSMKKKYGECVNFSDFQTIRFDSAQFNTNGGITAHGYMDGKYIAFKRNSILYVSGDGPLDTGADNNFTDPELISAETGCTEPRSVVLGPAGLFFKGEKGIYLLGRDLSTRYVGAGVEEFNSMKVTSAVHLDKKNLVVFTVVSDDLTEKYFLSYDYFTEQWSVSVGIRGIDSDVLDGDHVVLSSDTLTPMVQSGTDFQDDSTPYSMRLKTPWIKVSGIQDFGRVWRALIIGKYKSAHTLTVIARFDYDESYSETFEVTPQPTDVQYQYSCHFAKQKCEAIQLEIFDADQTGESMELTALTLEVGLRKGSMKLPAARKY
jgi:hypothetical protein